MFDPRQDPRSAGTTAWLRSLALLLLLPGCLAEERSNLVGDPCNRQGVCGNGLVCVDHRCNQGPPDCSLDQVCCTEDATCGPDEHCDRSAGTVGKCRPTCPTGTCPDGLACLDHLCQEGVPGCNGPDDPICCTRDATCGPEEYCHLAAGSPGHCAAGCRLTEAGACGPGRHCEELYGVRGCFFDVDPAAPPACGAACPPVEWVALPAGTFTMGSDLHQPEERPAHPVTLPAFQLLRTEVTVAQYRHCVEAGACSAAGLGDGQVPRPGTGVATGACNWLQADRADHPINCLDWLEARRFCTWIGGRLPSEAEWEYAARSAGQPREYPWGDEPATCARANMNEQSDEASSGCTTGRTAPVCSRPAGNSDQGLCDLAGNGYEWTEDCARPGYQGAPTDGRPWLDCQDDTRITRGGSYYFFTGNLRAAARSREPAAARYPNLGFRCAR